MADSYKILICSVLLLFLTIGTTDSFFHGLLPFDFDRLPQCNFDIGDTYSNCISTKTYANCNDDSANDEFRSHDGTCNNLLFTAQGASNTPLRRLLPADYLSGGDVPKGFPCRDIPFHSGYYEFFSLVHHKSKRFSPNYPTPHQVSTNLFKITTKNVRNLQGYSTMFMTFGQFLDHDMTLVPHESCKTESCGDEASVFKYPCFPIKFENHKHKCTGFGRSKPACRNKNYISRTRNQVNTITSYIDGSQIYGINEKAARHLRTLDGTGRLNLTSENLLPLDPHLIKDCKTNGGCSLVGDERADENIALHSMHTLWAREHNRIATQLKKINPTWSGDQIYNVARKIVGGQLQHIAFTEWLPNIVKLPTYRSYNKFQDSSIINAFASAAFRFGHSLIPNAFSQVDKSYNQVREEVLLQKAFFNTDYIHKHGIEPTLLGLCANQSNEVNTEMSEGIARKLFIPFGKAGYDDLAARNIQRGRDHGIHIYGLWRQRCKLAPITSFDDLTNYTQKGAADVFEKLYEHPNDIDLFAAGMAENHVPGLTVGPTFSCIFREQFLGLRDGDRFYYENSDVFTSNQLGQIRKSSLAKIICNNLKDVVSIQRDVFKVFTEEHLRVSCDSIEDIDYTLWKEEIPEPTCDIGNTYSNCIVTRNTAQPCNENAQYRNIDGTCNNFNNPTLGATNTVIRRITEPMYLDGTDTPRGFPCTPANSSKKIIHQHFPTAHEVSRTLFKITTSNMENQRTLSTMFMTFGQFLDHDLALTPHESCKSTNCSNTEAAFKYPCFPIKFNHNVSRCTGFARSLPACRTENDYYPGRNQVNKVTSFIDAGNVYGNEKEHARRLRTKDGTGRLKLTSNDLLPLDTLLADDCKTNGGCSLVGDVRADENIALHSMHTLWAREHNRIATQLKKINPTWLGVKIFEETRKIVGAMFQHIVYTEFLPKIVNLGPYYDYSLYADPSIINGFATAAFRFGHSIVPNAFSQLDVNFNEVRDSILLQEAFFNTKHIKTYGIESTIIGLMGNQSGETNTQFSEAVGRKLFVPFGDQSGYDDLMARNIQRGRDHGIPTYGRWRAKCDLEPLRTFEDLNQYMDPHAAQIFKDMYEHPDDIDLFAAGVAENHLPDLIVGPTFSCIFKHQFEALRSADSFFYTRPGVFKSGQLKALQQVTLARIMCNNLKDLISVQRDVFQSYFGGANRVECTSIPDLDLTQWKH